MGRKKLTLTEWTPKAALPRLFRDDQIEGLEDDTWYPGYFYNSAIGLKRKDALLHDWQKGVVKPAAVRCLNGTELGEKRKVGQSARAVILGSELKRVHPSGEGRIRGTFSAEVERLTA